MNLETTTAVYAGNVRLNYGMIIAQSHISFIMDAHGFPCVSEARRCIAECQKLHGIKGNAAGFSSYVRSFCGCFNEAGVVLGFSAAAALSSFYMGREFMKRMTGASSVGMMLFMTLMSLVSMFNDSDRGKAVITDMYHQRLPLQLYHRNIRRRYGVQNRSLLLEVYTAWYHNHNILCAVYQE